MRCEDCEMEMFTGEGIKHHCNREICVNRLDEMLDTARADLAALRAKLEAGEEKIACPNCYSFWFRCGDHATIGKDNMLRQCKGCEHKYFESAGVKFLLINLSRLDAAKGAPQ